MPAITFTVETEPVAQPRPKVSTRGGFARAYVAAKHPVHQYRQNIALAAKFALVGHEMAIGAVKLQIEFVMPRPKAYTWKKRVMPRMPDIRKPDWENLAKSVCDAMSGIVYRDDSQIVNASVLKVIAAGGEKPHTKIFVEWEV